MDNLRTWQKQFREGVRAKGDLKGLFETLSGASEEKRFFVYRNGFWLRVKDSLLEDFSLTARLLGEKAFLGRVREFLARKRSYELELGAVSSSFAKFLLGSEVAASVRRAVRLDSLALECRTSPEPEHFGGFGLAPSVRLLMEEQRSYCLWYGEDGVCRERISQRTARLLEVFRGRQGLAEISAKLEALGEEPAFVQGAVALWTELGAIISYSPRGE